MSLPAKRILAAFLSLLSCGPFGCRQKQSVEPAMRFQLSRLLGVLDGGADYARARDPRSFRFPDDHGPHPSFRNEWWYFTGNLVAEDGRRFGYQWTVFRTALAPTETSLARASGWATNQIYMAHFALSDARESQFQAFERFERGSEALSGAIARPFRVWVDDWSVESIGPNTFPARLRAKGSDAVLELSLEEGKPPILQGEAGLSRKGPQSGQASYYYSLTRMPTRGRIQTHNHSFSVAGHSWMDREWSTSALGEEQVGWDWFALQLLDGRELMYYQLRRRDGSADPFSAGTLVAANGQAIPLSLQNLSLRVTSHWQSPRDGARYPSGWQIDIASENLHLVVNPALADQELNLAIRYWEGAVDVRDHQGSRLGTGYAELTGYSLQSSRTEIER